MGLVRGILKKGIKEVGEDEGISLKIREGYGKLLFERKERNEERCTYLVSDFNGIWLKYLSHLCCIIIVLNMEGKVGHVM
jgi:hypothetical protein